VAKCLDEVAAANAEVLSFVAGKAPTSLMTPKARYP
jgi:hypothetical protein